MHISVRLFLELLQLFNYFFVKFVTYNIFLSTRTYTDFPFGISEENICMSGLKQNITVSNTSFHTGQQCYIPFKGTDKAKLSTSPHRSDSTEVPINCLYICFFCDRMNAYNPGNKNKLGFSVHLLKR